VTRKRLGFFTRVLDAVPPAERYRLALEQIVHAERMGLQAAWVAQHHFDGEEGGLPAPLVFLAQAAARTSAIRLGTGIITLPLENPVRVAEDTAVLDTMAGGRLEVGVGTGGTPSSYPAFGLDAARRAPVYDTALATLRDAWHGLPIGASPSRLYPPAPHLAKRVWQATFSVEGGHRAGLAGDGLLLSKTQPRPADAPQASLSDIQHPIVDAYLAALPAGVAPRILGSRGITLMDSAAEARRHAAAGLERHLRRLRATGRPVPEGTLDELMAELDVYCGTPEQVIAQLRTDTVLARVTDISMQVHPVDPPHPLILRAIELFATVLAPAMDWCDAPAGRRTGT
jgi:putative FMN-dependent luciferase-like monooxygenase